MKIVKKVIDHIEKCYAVTEFEYDGKRHLPVSYTHLIRLTGLDRLSHMGHISHYQRNVDEHAEIRYTAQQPFCGV